MRESYGAGRVLEFAGGGGTLHLHALPESEIRHPCDLEGASIGIPDSASVLLLGVRRMLLKSSCDVEEIWLKFLSVENRLDALLSGQIQAAAFVEPWSSEARSAGATSTFQLDGSLCSRCAVGVIASRREWAEANAETLSRFDDAFARATALSNDSETAFRAELVACCALGIEEAADIAMPLWTEDQSGLRDAVHDMMSVMREDGAGLGTLSAEDFLLGAS